MKQRISRYSLVFIIALTLGLLSGCSNSDEPKLPEVDYSITLDKEIFSISSNGGVFHVTCKSEVYIEVDYPSEWIYISDAEYIDNNTIVYSFTIIPYEGDDIRSGIVRFYNEEKSKELCVNQYGAKIISPSKDNIVFWDNGGSESIQLSSVLQDIEYSVECEAEWLSASIEQSTLKVMADLLPSESTLRNATIIVNAAEIGEIAISITQKRLISLKNHQSL